MIYRITNETPMEYVIEILVKTRLSDVENVEKTHRGFLRAFHGEYMIYAGHDGIFTVSHSIVKEDK